MLIIVGLGNPTEQYGNTYHNMGYRALDKLCDRLGKKCKRLECSSSTAVMSYKGDKIVFAKPLTYMNSSGIAVKSLLNRYGALPSELVVIYDDIDLPRFTLRAREAGSGGTHNGMRNIIEEIGTTEFKRIRIGIGRDEGELKDYVLSAIRDEDAANFSQCFDKVAEELFKYIERRDFNALMRELNKR